MVNDMNNLIETLMEINPELFSGNQIIFARPTRTPWWWRKYMERAEIHEGRIYINPKIANISESEARHRYGDEMSRSSQWRNMPSRHGRFPVEWLREVSPKRRIWIYEMMLSVKRAAEEDRNTRVNKIQKWAGSSIVSGRMVQ